MTKDELRKSLDFVCEERERLQRELERKDNEIKQLREDIKNHIKIASEYKEQMIIKDNNWNELKDELVNDSKFEMFYADENINTVMTLGAKYYREYILDKIKELENAKNS